MIKNKYKLNLSRYSTHNIIIKLIGKNKTVLDVGCNEGYIGKKSDKSNIFYGIDNLQNVLQIAKKKYKKVAYYDLNNLIKLPWKLKYDVIIFGDVLEHVVSPNNTLKYFVDNYLKNNGKIIVSLPNIANWQVRLSLLIGNFNYTNVGILDKTHLHFYTFKTAKKLIEDCGLTVKKVFFGSSFFGYFIKFVFLMKGLFATSIILEVCKNE